MKKSTRWISILTTLMLCATAQADFSHNFRVDGSGGFSGDGVGGTSDIFTDGTTGAQVTFTTLAVSGSTIESTIGLGLGVDDALFSPGESWTFSGNRNLELKVLDFHNFTVVGEVFTFQSDDFIGLSLTPGNGDIAFNSIAGLFTISASGTGSNDPYDLTALSGGAALAVSSGTGMTITYTAGGGARFDGFTFSAEAVPEPATAGLLGISAIVFYAIRRIKNFNRTV